MWTLCVRNVRWHAQAPLDSSRREMVEVHTMLDGFDSDDRRLLRQAQLLTLTLSYICIC